MAGSKTILCIEDEHFISELYARALRKAGYEVTIMLSGEDGLTAALKDNYDIILLDLMLPEMSGIEILEKLRGQNSEKDIKSKIIITTNLDQDHEHRDKVEQLADGYLIKAEVTPNKLVKIISTIKIADSD